MTITIDGLQNFRDTGGTPLGSGGATRTGVLYRSEALSSLTPTGLDQLAATDIGVIADFRTDVERAWLPISSLTRGRSTSSRFPSSRAR